MTRREKPIKSVNQLGLMSKKAAGSSKALSRRVARCSNHPLYYPCKTEGSYQARDDSEIVSHGAPIKTMAGP